MKILYRQAQKSDDKKHSDCYFADYGIKKCYFKYIEQKTAGGDSAKKKHSHTCYEFHMMINGIQSYESQGTVFQVREGEFLMIPPLIAHMQTDSDRYIKKYALTFSLESNSALNCLPQKCIKGTLPEEVMRSLAFVHRESEEALGCFEEMIESRIFETVVLMIRASGGVINNRHTQPAPSRDARVELVKQYVKDNIEEQLSVTELSAYCYVCERHLTRIFMACEGKTVAEYVREEKVRHIEELLRDTDLTLSEISERMKFSTESGFNAFFKKNNGMSPGEYRKMIL